MSYTGDKVNRNVAGFNGVNRKVESLFSCTRHFRHPYDVCDGAKHRSFVSLFRRCFPDHSPRCYGEEGKGARCYDPVARPGRYW